MDVRSNSFNSAVRVCSFKRTNYSGKYEINRRLQSRMQILVCLNEEVNVFRPLSELQLIAQD